MEESNEIVNQTENLLLDKIADVNLFKLHIQPDCSLYQGKMGMAIFYFLYAINKQTENYKLFAEKIIDSIYDDINNSLPINLYFGLTGIGWGINYLYNKKILCGDLNEILCEIDRKLMEYNLNRMEDISISTGVEGILWYILLRIESTPNTIFVKNENLMNLKRLCTNSDWMVAKLILNKLKGKHINTYPYNLILLTMIQNCNKDDLSWKNGLRILLQKGIFG